MSSILFEQLENAGLIRGNSVIQDAVASAEPSELIDLAAESAEITSASEVRREHTVYAHFASLSLGGGRRTCQELGCRINRADQLAQFAALYSDRVYIDNFLVDHVPHHGSRTPDSEHLRTEFAKDLSVLTQLRPLIEAGRVVPLTPPSNYCAHCLAKRSFGEHADERLDREYDRLLRRFKSETSIEITNHGDCYIVHVDGPARLLEHGGSAFMFTRLPQEFRRLAGVENLLPGQTVRLSRKKGARLTVHERLADEVFENVVTELAVAQSLGTIFLTERPLHVDILNGLSEDRELERRNQVIQKHLTALVPFISDISVADLLELRNREDEAFQQFRQALNAAVDAVREERSGLTERDARTIYSDLIAPQLSRLDARVKQGQRGLIKMSRRKAIAWSAAISFGAYTGLGPAGLAAAAAALGLTKILAEFAEKAMSQSDTEESIAHEDMYFLWKVRQLSSGAEPF